MRNAHCVEYEVDVTMRYYDRHFKYKKHIINVTVRVDVYKRQVMCVQSLCHKSGLSKYTSCTGYYREDGLHYSLQPNCSYKYQRDLRT